MIDYCENFIDNIFAPNQAVNLNDLETEEREIETFKRFNYYFDPPKTKPKINLNVKDIVVNNKQPTVPVSMLQPPLSTHNHHECTSPLPKQHSPHQQLHHSQLNQHQHIIQQQQQHLHDECGESSSAYNHQSFIEFLKNSNFHNNFPLNNGPIGSDIKYKYDNIIE